MDLNNFLESNGMTTSMGNILRNPWL